MPSTPQIFTPAGGMNQDDSLIAPSKNTGGKSSFEGGDYRYALNSRIGSSRTDNYEDLEIFKSTVEVEDYYVLGDVFSNWNFNGSLAGWSQLSSSPDNSWLYIKPSFVVLPGGLPQSFHNVLYQSISPSLVGETLTIKFRYRYAEVAGPKFQLVFLDGTSEISRQDISLDAGIVESSAQITIPANCDGLGLTVEGVLATAFQLYYAKITSWVAGSLPAGNEKVRGRLDDKEFLKVFYCVYNDAGNHCLRMYDYQQNRVYELLKWSGLNFQENRYIKMAKLDNWLAITDRHNAPRLFDVDEISTLFLNLGESEFREFHISFHKWAPTAPPVLRAFYQAPTNNWDILKNKDWQFSYRYVYYGNLRSRFSPISKSAITSLPGLFYSTSANLLSSIEVYIPGFILDEPGANVEYNYFEHSDPKFYFAVKQIEIVFREGELDTWKLWKRIDVTNEIESSHYFDGKFNSRPISIDDFYQPFDTVPLLAGTVEAIDNRFMFGDCLNEYEPLQNFAVENVSAVKSDSTGWIYSGNLNLFTSLSTGDSNLLKRENSLANYNFKERGQYKLGFIFSDHKGWTSLVYTTDDWGYEIGVDYQLGQAKVNGLQFTIPDDIIPPSWATSFRIVRLNCQNIDYFMIGHANSITPLIDNASSLISATTLPDAIKQKLMEHFENSSIVDGYSVTEEINKAYQGRSSLLNFTENLVARTGISKSLIYNQDRDISKNKYLRFNTLRFKIAPEIRNSTTSTLANASRLYIDINNWYNASQETGTKNYPLNKLYYNFREGDRVRFVGSTVSNPTLVSQLTVYDVEILEFTGSGIIVEKPAGILSVYDRAVSFWDQVGNPIEVYTPVKRGESNYVFYETGEWYPILYPGTELRDFSKRDWTFTNDGAITCDTYGPFKVFNKVPVYAGDCTRISKRIYLDLKNIPATTTIALSMNTDPDMTYDFWERHNGRPNIPYLDLPESKFFNTQIRFGGKIIEESNVNALNRFREEDQNVYPSEYGRIRDLVNTSNAQVESVGSILLAIGEREAWSIYVNRSTLQDLGGETIVTVSDKVLGSFNTLLGSHGTLNPESISKERGNVYWWNAIDGVWVRYGRDGLTAISDYKMRGWYKQLSALIFNYYVTDDIPWVISEFDSFHEELITRIDHSSLPATFRGYDTYKGTTFSEADTRWKSVHSYDPELFSKIGTELLSFKDGRLYRHEQGSNYLNFYDAKFDAYIEPVFNAESMNVKSWQGIAIVSTHGWSVERVLSEYRGVKDKQESRILLGNFTQKEDTYYADFKMDLNTPNVTDPIVNGNKMRSKAIQVLLKLDPTVEDLSLLHWVVVSTIDSPKNPVNL